MKRRETALHAIVVTLLGTVAGGFVAGAGGVENSHSPPALNLDTSVTSPAGAYAEHRSEYLLAYAPLLALTPDILPVNSEKGSLLAAAIPSASGSSMPAVGPAWEQLFKADGKATADSEKTFSDRRNGVSLPESLLSSGNSDLASLTPTEEISGIVDHQTAPGAQGNTNGNAAVNLFSGGQDAVFLPDNISDGRGVDMSSLRPADMIADMLVDNDTVEAGHDLGNAYVYATTNAKGHAVLYAAAERLGADYVDSYVDFEFNQGIVQVWGGVPWPVHGERTTGDLSIRVNFIQGLLTSLEARVWDDAAASFRTLFTRAIQPETNCAGVAGSYAVCIGKPTSRTAPGPVRDEVRDVDIKPIKVPAPDSFVQIGVDVTSLLGYDAEFTSIQVKTPEDIILSCFRNIGHWSHQDRSQP